MIAQLDSKYQSLLNSYLQQEGQRKYIQEKLDNLVQKYLDNSSELNFLQEDIKLLQTTTRTAQNSVKHLVEDIVTKGLQAIFYDRTYRCVINLVEEKRTATADFILEEFIDGEWKARDFSDVGGGIVDVVSVLLRITGLVLRRPQQQKILWLDEPFKHVWVNYQARISSFLAKICKELDIQIILTTHCMEVTSHADEVWEAVKQDNECTLHKKPIPEGDLSNATSR